jgi:hypothetical protein
MKSASMRRDWKRIGTGKSQEVFMWDSRLRLRSEFVTFSKLPKIDAANKAVTTTKSSKI